MQNLITDLVYNIVNHKDLKLYFDAESTIFTEKELITVDKQILIPDRLIFDKNNKVSILDYKTGNPEKKHHLQINNYAIAIEKMKLKVSDKILVYIDQEIKIVKV